MRSSVVRTLAAGRNVRHELLSTQPFRGPGRGHSRICGPVCELRLSQPPAHGATTDPRHSITISTNYPRIKNGRCISKHSVYTTAPSIGVSSLQALIPLGPCRRPSFSTISRATRPRTRHGRLTHGKSGTPFLHLVQFLPTHRAQVRSEHQGHPVQDGVGRLSRHRSPLR